MSKCARWWRTLQATRLRRTMSALCCLRPASVQPISRQRLPLMRDAAADLHRQRWTRAALMMLPPRRLARQAAAVVRWKRSRWPPEPHAAGVRAMPDRPYSVLFLCTGNSARSVLAEAILHKIGAGKFKAYSAGSQPKGQVNPNTLQLLKWLGYDTTGYWSKSWQVFAQPTAPSLDFVFTVCDDAAGEVCP